MQSSKAGMFVSAASIFRAMKRKWESPKEHAVYPDRKKSHFSATVVVVVVMTRKPQRREEREKTRVKQLLLHCILVIVVVVPVMACLIYIYISFQRKKNEGGSRKPVCAWGKDYIFVLQN